MKLVNRNLNLFKAVFPGRSISYLIVLSIFSVIFFDALQQKFYLDTFNLYPNTTITFLDILENHLIRWLIWTIVSISYVGYSWQKFTKTDSPIGFKTWAIISALVFGANLVSIVLICFTSIFEADSELNLALFTELFTFMFYQKGLSFIFASSLLVLLIYNRANSMVIDAQWVEIKNLKEQPSTTYEDKKPTLNIKIGNKLKVIPISDVHWFEADDYCVKVHTMDKTYTMRKSLKSLQKELASLKFVRVHRSALLNLNYLDHIDFHSSTVKLQDTSEIPISKSGASLLKKILHTKSV